MEERSFSQCASLVAQRDDGVDAHRPPAGDGSGAERHEADILTG
jgi:hypothetical protein